MLSLYKEPLESGFSPFLIALDNLCEVFGSSFITDFTSIMFRF